MNPNDTRVVQTRARVRAVFYTLLAEKPVSRITVKEICEQAGINRSTFYKHYADPYDLLEQCEASMLANLQQRLDAVKSQDHTTLIREVLRYMQQSGKDFGALSSVNGDPTLPAKLFSMTYQMIYPRFAQRYPNLSPEQCELLYQYLTAGCSSVLSHWVQNGIALSVDEVVQFLQRANSGLLQEYRIDLISIKRI